jgi:sRNA-binding protein
MSTSDVTEDTKIAHREQLTEQLRQQYPAVFCDPPVPFAIGMYEQIRDASKISHRQLRRVMRWWVSQPAYLQSVVDGQVRRNLDGTPTSQPNEKEIDHATRKLQKFAKRSVVAA